MWPQRLALQAVSIEICSWKNKLYYAQEELQPALLHHQNSKRRQSSLQLTLKLVFGKRWRFAAAGKLTSKASWPSPPSCNAHYCAVVLWKISWRNHSVSGIHKSRGSFCWSPTGRNNRIYTLGETRGDARAYLTELLLLSNFPLETLHIVQELGAAAHNTSAIDSNVQRLKQT